GTVEGATVSSGGRSATNVNVHGSTTETAVPPVHASGVVNVVVTNPDSQSSTSVNGFSYASAPAPAPTVTSISPASGPTTGGTPITISGTGFVSGATVKLGGTAAT